jgi:DNA-binding MarR family transcriptional regulator
MKTAEERRRLIDGIIELGERESWNLPPVIPEDWLALDLTMPQLKMLMCIYAHGPQRVSEIAASVGVSQAVVTGVTDRLIHRGLVERGGDPHDRRVVVCSLSDEGRQLGHRLWESGIDRGRKLMEVMTLEELQLLSEAVEMVFGVLSRVRGKLGADESVSRGPAPATKRD